MRKLYRVTLTQAERKQLLELTRTGKSTARTQAHARVLLQADESEDGLSRSDAEIYDALGVAVSTIERVRQRFVEEGLEAALERRPPNRVYERILDGAAEAHLIALVCSKPPEDRDCPSLGRETVRRTLKKTR